MANNSYISKVNLPNDNNTYLIKDDEARETLLQLQNNFVSKDGDTIDGTLNVTDVNAGTLLVTGNASFVNGLHGDLDGNATTATTAATATEANHAASATTATSATSAEKIRINNEDVSVGDYLTPAYFIDGVPTQSAGKTIPLINGTGTTAGTWLGSLNGLTAYSDGLLILYKIPIAGASTTTLNINSIGAKTVYWNNASKLTTHFPVNQIIMLVYCASLNSGSWVCIDTYNSDADHYTTPWCNTSASTAAKVAACNGYVLRQNQVFPVLMATTNTSQSLLTLNINGTGAKNIYINGTISSSSNYTLPAGIYFVYYNGTNYYFNTDNIIDTNISGNAATADSAITATKANKVIDSNNNSTEITITSSKTAQTTTSNLASWNGNEIGKISPEALKGVMSLDNVENKNSATIRGELTKKNVTDALGYTPPTEDTDTHYTTHIYAGNGTAANSTSDLTDPKIAVADNTTVASTNGYIQLKGDGLTDVKAKNGIVTINTPTSHDHTTDDIVPIQTMTYTGILGTADNSAASDSFYFMRMRPTTFYDQWMLHYRVTAFIPNQTNYRTTSDVILYGYGQASAPAMKTFNTVYNTSYRPIYYNNFYRLNSTGYNGNCYNAVGVGLNGSNARNSAGYERTIVVELLETYNCTAELLNSVVKWENWESASSNYAGLSQFDACTNGLQETGDNNDVTTQRFQYSHLTAGENGIKMYSLVMMDSSGKWQSFTTGSGGTATTKAKNTTGFVPGMIYYVSRNSDLDPNGVTADNQLHRHMNLVDLRYSTNCGQTLTANKMVYIVGTMSDGLFYLNNTWWTQTEPTQADDKVYIPIGITYDKYRADLLNWQGMYYHNGTNFVPYYEATASSHATSSDLLEFQSTIPTNASQVGNAGTITGLTVSKIGSISDFATTDVYAPASNAGMLLNMGYSDTYGHQVFVDDTSNMLVHRYNNNGTWQNWQQILDTSIFPISIENGGTNATTIQDAANNLQVVSLGQGIPITTTQNTNIDNIVAIGNYYCSSNSYVSSLGGTLPSGLGNNAFTLKVGYSTGTGFKYQELRQYSNGRTWYRVKGSNSDSANWGSWNPYYQLSSIALTGDTTGTATSSVGAWSIATQTKRVHYLGRLTSANLDFSSNDYKSKLTYMLASTSMTEGKPPSDAGILNFAWDNNKWGSQLAIRMTSTPHIYIRGNNNVSWDTEWLTVLDSNNYSDYTVTKTGGGASGDWNINAATATSATTATKFSSDKTIELTGDVTGSVNSDGESGWSIATTIANSSVTNGKLANDSITIAGNKLELGQSLDAPTLVASLELSTAMHFIGRATVVRDNANFPAITNYTPASGDVVLGLNDNIEYVYDGTSWLILGAESSYKVVQTQVNDPTASGSSSQFISSITQYPNGEISVTKKNLPTIELTGAITNVNELSNDNSTLTITTTIPDNSLSRSKMMMTDMMNYAELNDYSASLWGFTTDTTAVDGHWYSINNSSYSGRTKPISPMYQCVGGETFNIQYEICHNTMGTPTEASGGGDPRYTSARIALVTYNDNLVNATSTGNVYATGTTGDENSTLVAVNCNVTLSENARRFKVHVYRGGSSYTNGGYTGTIKIRKLKVTRVSAPMWYGDLSGTATTATNVATQSTSAILNTTQRHIWFSSSNTETQRAYSDNFYYVSQTNTVHANLDGNAATADTATTADALSGFKISTTTNLGIDATDINQAIGHVSGLTSATWNNQQTIGALYRQVYSADQIHQIFGDYSTGHIAVRGRKNGTWGNWHSVIDDDNWSNVITKSALGLGNVENKSVATIKSEILTSANIISALGYTPLETVTAKIFAGSGTAANATTTNGYTKITVASNGTVQSNNGYITIKGTGAASVTSDGGVITVNSENSHNTAYIYAGTSTGNANATTTDGNTHIILKDGSSVSSRVKITGDGATSVVSDANGTITISSTNTWTPMTGATASADGTAGYVSAPPSNGYNTKYLRADGTWEVPPDTWNPLVGAQQNVDGTAGYAPQPLKGTDYNKKYLCSDGTWKKPSIGDLSGVPISIENGGTGESSDLAAITSLGSIYTKAGGTQITSQKNLDTEFNTPGTYYSPQKSISENLLGTVPITGSGFKLYTIGGYAAGRPRQIIDVGGSNTALLQRTSPDGGSSWNKWHKFVFIPSGSDNKTFSAVGSSTQPVYVTSSGVVIAITGAIANDTTGNSATSNKFSSSRTIELTGDTTGTASSDGTNGWSITTTTSALTSIGRYGTSATKLSLNDIDFSTSDFKKKIVLLHADANTLFKPEANESGVTSGTTYNGNVINIGWDNTGSNDKYGTQIIFTNGSASERSYMYFRGRHNNDNWDEWHKMLDDGNYTDYTVTKTGTGATGTWGIDISGNATTATSAGSATNDANGDAIDSTYAKLSGATFTGQVYGDMINVNASKTKTTGGLGLYGNSSGLNYSIMMRGTDTTSDGLGTHGYVTGDWATYFNQAGISTHPDDRGWIFRSGLQSSEGLVPVASISGSGHAVFNGSVTVGGNAGNTSGVRLEYSEAYNSLDFVFV